MCALTQWPHLNLELTSVPGDGIRSGKCKIQILCTERYRYYALRIRWDLNVFLFRHPIQTVKNLLYLCVTNLVLPGVSWAWPSYQISRERNNNKDVRCNKLGYFMFSTNHMNTIKQNTTKAIHTGFFIAFFTVRIFFSSKIRPLGLK